MAPDVQVLSARRPPLGLRDAIVVGLFFAGVVALSLGVSTTSTLAFAASFVTALLLVPPVARFVRARGWEVLPGGRSVHVRRTPLLGGVSIFIPFFVATVLAGWLGDRKAFGLAAGAVVMLVCGVYDDVRGVRPRVKIAAQLAAGACLVVAGFRLPTISVPGLGTLPLGVLEIPVILFWVTLAANAVNLTDGMDGLAASLAIVGCAGCVLVGAHVVPAVVLAGASLGFLRHNLAPASIFLGDAGSMLIGYALAAFALDAPASVNAPVAYGLLAYSIGDVGLAITRRLLRGKPIFVGDKSHIHHKLREHLHGRFAPLSVAIAFASIQLALALTVPGVVSLALSFVLWITLAVALMAIGRVRIRHLLSARGAFQRLHLIRRYVAGRLRLTETKAEIEDVLQRFVYDVRIASLELGDLRFPGVETAGAAVVEIDVPLKTRAARWTWVPSDEQRALDDERRAVICEVIRSAEERLLLLAARGLLDPPAAP